MLKSHKIALKTSDKHRQWFSQQCGYARVAYNYALNLFRSGIKMKDLRPTFNRHKSETFPWSKDMDQRASTYGIMNLEDAIKRWKSGQNKFPRFKKKGSRQSYSMEGQKVKIKGKRIKLPKIGWIPMFEELRFEGIIKKVTISRTAHRWFVSITVKTEDTPEVVDPTLPVIGIDVGINSLATLSDGTKYENPRPLRRYTRKLSWQSKYDWN